MKVLIRSGILSDITDLLNITNQLFRSHALAQIEYAIGITSAEINFGTLRVCAYLTQCSVCF